MLDKIFDMLAFAKPIRIIERPESLLVQDYRPTWMMALAGGGFVLFTVAFVAMLVNFDTGVDSFGLWATGIFAAGCLIFALRGSVREVYYFDKTTDSYRFVRQFVHRKEVIEGSLSQFTGASVETVEHDESESYHVVLNQEGMFLTGVSEQTLREETPILNSFSNEASIANAISAVIHSAKYEREKRSASEVTQ